MDKQVLKWIKKIPFKSFKYDKLFLECNNDIQF